MKKSICILLILVTLALSFFGCGKKPEEPVSTTAAETTTKSATAPKPDYDKDRSFFDNCAFVGNSRVETFLEIGVAPKSDVFAKVGLTINSVFEDSMPGHSATVAEEIGYTDYDWIILVFGDNETGWINTDVFIKDYKKFISYIRRVIPGTKICVSCVLPISKAAEQMDENLENGYSKETIDALNVKIKAMCEEENVVYAGVPYEFTDNEDYLRDEAASDGVHFGKKYCLIWLDYLQELLEGKN